MGSLSSEEQYMKQVIIRKNKGKGYITVSTTVSPEYYVKAQKYNISWAVALREGLALLFSRLGDTDLNNPYQMALKVEGLAEKLAEVAQEKEKLRMQLESMKK